MTDPKLARPSWRGRTNVDALTIACIEHAEQLVRHSAPNTAHDFIVTQGSYQSTVAASAGTHDKGGAVDLRWCGHFVCLHALRRAGMAAWHRTPAQGPWPDHVHAVVIGHPLLADSAHRQVIAYLNGRNGLKNDGADDGPRLDPIPRPVWPYPQEDDMPLSNDDIDRIAAAVAKTTPAAVLAAEIADDGRTVKKALRQASKVVGLEDRIADRVVELLGGTPGTGAGVYDDVDIKAAVKQALREGTDD